MLSFVFQFSYKSLARKRWGDKRTSGPAHLKIGTIRTSPRQPPPARTQDVGGALLHHHGRRMTGTTTSSLMTHYGDTTSSWMTHDGDTSTLFWLRAVKMRAPFDATSATFATNQNHNTNHNRNQNQKHGNNTPGGIPLLRNRRCHGNPRSTSYRSRKKTSPQSTSKCVHLLPPPLRRIYSAPSYPQV